MADIANKYYQVSEDGEASQPTSSGRWFKAGIVFISGSCLILMSIMATSTSSITSQGTMASEPTNLAGMSTFLRSSPGAAMKPLMGPAMLPGSGPFKQIALSAIKLNILANSKDVSRDVLARAEADLKEAASSGEAKEVVEKVTQKTAKKASEIINDMPGILPPTGLFDPLGFATDCSAGKLLFYREVELKHGRVGMLAALGFLVGENFHPLFGGNIDVPSYVAFQQTPLQTFWPAVTLAIAIPELFSVFSFQDPSMGETWTMRQDRMPGDFNFDPLGLKPEDPKEFKEMQNKELNNGRLAMLAAAGMIAQELATGKKLF